MKRLVLPGARKQANWTVVNWSFWMNVAPTLP